MRYLLLSAVFPALLLATVSKQYPIGDFTNLVVKGNFRTLIEQSGKPSLMIASFSSDIQDSNGIAKSFDVKQEGQTLYISAIPGAFVVPRNDYILLNARKLKSLTVLDKNIVQTKPLNLLPNASISVSGESRVFPGNITASNLNIYTNQGNLYLSNVSAVNVTIQNLQGQVTAHGGSIDNLFVNTTGRSVDLGNLSVKNADLKATDNILMVTVKNSAKVSAKNSGVRIEGGAKVSVESDSASLVTVDGVPQRAQKIQQNAQVPNTLKLSTIQQQMRSAGQKNTQKKAQSRNQIPKLQNAQQLRPIGIVQQKKQNAQKPSAQKANSQKKQNSQVKSQAKSQSRQQTRIPIVSPVQKPQI